MNSENYYKQLEGKKVICVDFDNTICLDEWPYVGAMIPGAKEVLTKLMNEGHKLILYTQRSHNYPICCKELEEYSINAHGSLMGTVDLLTPAIKVCNDNGIGFWNINKNTLWEEITGDNSRKVFNDLIIDDHLISDNLNECVNKFGEKCLIIDWWEIDRWCVEHNLYNESAFKNTKFETHLSYLFEIDKISK